MTRQRRGRYGDDELNFDGLTDAVTNLVGALILLVVLVIAVTGPKQLGVEELPPPENTAGESRAIDQLLARMQQLRVHLTEVERDITTLEARVPDLESEIAALAAK